jgi:AraC-like DNA-binding protein
MDDLTEKMDFFPNRTIIIAMRQKGLTLDQLIRDTKRRGQKIEDIPPPLLREAQKRGFPDMRSVILPPPLIRDALTRPLLRDLLVTRIGYCSHAVGHYIPRPEGSLDHILHYCVAGRGWVRMAGRHWEVTADTMTFLPRGEPHLYGADAEHPWSIYWIHFTGRQADAYFNAIQVTAKSPLLHLRATPEILTAFQQIEESMREVHTPTHLLAASTALARFLGLIQLRRFASSQQQRTEQEQVQATITLMKDNLTRPLFLRELAQAAHMSVSRYEVAFSNRTGCSPINFFNRMRIQKACHSLDSTKHPVKQIASDLGFEDPYYFSRLFKKLVGVSPAGFRKQKSQRCH